MAQIIQAAILMTGDLTIYGEVLRVDAAGKRNSYLRVHFVDGTSREFKQFERITLQERPDQ